MLIESITPRHLTRAFELLTQGHLVAIPTETVYGLGALATSEDAVQKIFAAKGRPAINPLICHVLDIEMANRFAFVDPIAKGLAHAFWPGPLTLVLPRKGEAIAPSVTAGLPTIALRAPAHHVMRKLIEMLDQPIAAPSANRSGRMSPTLPQHVARDFDDILILDDGPTAHGLESTVVTIENGRVILLRHGALPIEALADHLGYTPAQEAVTETPRSPGQLLKHYAPKTKLILNSTTGPITLGFGTGGTLDLSPSANVQEAAQNLFAMLQTLDERAQSQGISEIHIAPIPSTGIGAAIHDRLLRAAHSAGK